MTQYNLDFFEAMEAYDKGNIVQCAYDDATQIQYDPKDESEFCSVPIKAIKAKWRIVEPEKCWLDRKYPDGRDDKHQRYAARNLAFEAIKRIGAAHVNGYSSSSVAIGILKEMIGEVK